MFEKVIYSMLSLYKLEIFAEVIHAGSFSAAAKRLHMTQPAVSQHIQDLEASLGTELFTRGRRGVTLTQSGERLAHYTTQILRLVAEAESEVTEVANLKNAQMTVGATPGISTYLLPSWLHQFRVDYPNVNVMLQTGTTSQNIERLLDHQLDIAFVEGELDGIEHHHIQAVSLRTVTLYVVVSPSHRWADRDTLSVDLLNGQPMITRQANSRTRIYIDQLLKAQGIQARIVGEFDNPEAIKQATMADMGFTILPDYAVERERQSGLVHTLVLDQLPMQREIKLIYDQRMPFTAMARALLQQLTLHFPNLEMLYTKSSL